jgi:hypothetical protein
VAKNPGCEMIGMPMHDAIIIERAPDGGYSVYVPDLPDYMVSYTVNQHH